MPWLPARPAQRPDGPPGLAALLDAERSVLRDLHERQRVAAEADHSVGLRTLALEDAVRLQQGARRQSRGMRDRLRARELDRRILTADARSELSTARSALEAAQLRVRAVEQRLVEVRELVDAQAGDGHPLVEAIRRTAELPATVRVFPTIAAFIADEPARAIGDPRQQDLRGEPLGERWQLEEPGKPWITTYWRVSWASSDDAARDTAGELFAVERALRPRAARRVLLLGEAAPGARPQIEALLTRQAERNSLAVLAASVA